jgi:hypothetical protein
MNSSNSVISVVCKETGEEVAQIAGKISAIDEDGERRGWDVCNPYVHH